MQPSGEIHDPSTEKKVDESWKEAVRREKQGGVASSPDPSAAPPHGPLPEAPDFALFLSSLGTQALAALGETPHPSGGVKTDLREAKYLIDMLGLLEEKTKGNLTSQEQAFLKELLYELRLKFVNHRRKENPT